MKCSARFIALFIALTLCMGIVHHTSALTIASHSCYVSPSGNDTNLGTQEQPFATLQKAVDSLVGKLGFTGIFVEKGTYFLTEPIRIKTSIDLYINGYDVTISGGRKITGFKTVSSEQGKKGLVVADVPDAKEGKWNFRDLYVNDQRAIRAREPNVGYFRIEKAGEDCRTNFIYKEGDLKKWKDLAVSDAAHRSDGGGNVELVFLHDWSITRCPIKEIDESSRRLTVPHRIGCDLDFFKIDNWEPHPRYFVENSFEFLDAPGEWFLDTKEGRLYYILKEGESADTLEVIAPVATQLLVIEGTADQRPDVTVSGIRFAHSAYFPKPENTVWETQAAAYMTPGGSGHSQFLPSPAAVHAEFARVLITVCQFEHLGENGLWFAKGCRDSVVNNSVFRDIGANGIMIGTHNHADTVVNCSVTQSLVEKTGETLFGAIGIWIGITQETLIDDNIIRELPYGGISLGWQWNPQPTPARANVIRNNLIYNCIQTLSDSGGIYTLGYQPDSIIEKNIIYGIPRAQGNAESNGMFLDEGTKGFIIRNNVIYDTAQSSLRFHQADTNIVKDNVLINKTGVPPIRYNSTPEKNIELINNRVLVVP